MKNSQRFSLSKRLKSFRYAFNGLRILLIEEHNARIHLFVTLSVLIVSVYLKISISEWVVIILVIGFVFSLEIINSSIENLADFVCQENDIRIKKIKDLSAAAVLVSAIMAIVIGLIIFLPKIFVLFH